MAGVAKLAGQRWKALSDADKEPFEKDYQAKSAAYQEAMKSYVPLGGGSGADECDEEQGENNDAASPPTKKAKVATAVVAKSAGRGRGKGRGRGSAKEPEADFKIPAGVLSKAEQAGMADTLRKLMGREDIKAHGVDAKKALVALQANTGLMHKARHSLLGA